MCREYDPEFFSVKEAQDAVSLAFKSKASVPSGSKQFMVSPLPFWDPLCHDAHMWVAMCCLVTVRLACSWHVQFSCMLTKSMMFFVFFSLQYTCV